MNSFCVLVLLFKRSGLACLLFISQFCILFPIYAHFCYYIASDTTQKGFSPKLETKNHVN